MRLLTDQLARQVTLHPGYAALPPFHPAPPQGGQPPYPPAPPQGGHPPVARGTASVR